MPYFCSSPTREYVIPEELGPGTIVANITAEDPDDQSFTSFLLYSITILNSYFMINQCKLHSHHLRAPFNSSTNLDSFSNILCVFWSGYTFLSKIPLVNRVISVLNRVGMWAGETKQHPMLIYVSLLHCWGRFLCKDGWVHYHEGTLKSWREGLDQCCPIEREQKPHKSFLKSLD